MKGNLTYRLIAAAVLTVSSVWAHEPGYSHLHGSTNDAYALVLAPEKKGPVTAPVVSPTVKVSGTGYWTFAAAPELLVAPEETRPYLKGAHGTIVIDRERDVVYWGLERVGWVGFSNKLSQSWVIKGDPALSSGNLHGADLLPRKGGLPLVVATDNVEGEVYLSDTTFQHARKLAWPRGGPYKNRGEYKPTDAAFLGESDIYVTDGYGKQFFMHATLDPFEFDGTFIGGREFSKTPHGVTYSARRKSLYVAARSEGQIKEYVLRKDKWRETLALPAGSTVCDIDLWDDYALAPCLDGPEKSPGPIYIVNLKKRTIAAVIQPKDLGYGDAQHIHDAAWYVTGKGKSREVYILFTNWNPGGIGALKLVNAASANPFKQPGPLVANPLPYKTMKSHWVSFAFALLCSASISTAAARDFIVFEGGKGPGQGKHVVLLSGDEEYRSEEALPMLGRLLAQKHGFKCTVLFALDKDGAINPDAKTSLPGSEALDSADAIILSLRFRDWPDAQMKRFAEAFERGVPIIALRTSTHAFQLGAASHYRSFNQFGKKVLGEEWVSHWGRHKVEATRGIVEAAHRDHPVLSGVKEVFGNTDVYEAYPPQDATILLRGQVLKGMEPKDPPASYTKKRATDKVEQDVNDPMMPVAWTREFKNESGKTNRILTTTMGSATDLTSEGLRRLVVNGVYWGLKMKMPASAVRGN